MASEKQQKVKGLNAQFRDEWTAESVKVVDELVNAFSHRVVTFHNSHCTQFLMALRAIADPNKHRQQNQPSIILSPRALIANIRNCLTMYKQRFRDAQQTGPLQALEHLECILKQREKHITSRFCEMAKRMEMRKEQYQQQLQQKQQQKQQLENNSSNKRNTAVVSSSSSSSSTSSSKTTTTFSSSASASSSSLATTSSSSTSTTSSASLKMPKFSSSACNTTTFVSTTTSLADLQTSTVTMLVTDSEYGNQLLPVFPRFLPSAADGDDQKQIVQ